MLGVHVMGDVVSVKEKSSLIAYEGTVSHDPMYCCCWSCNTTQQMSLGVLCLVCLFDLACFFLSSFSSLIKTCICTHIFSALCVCVCVCVCVCAVDDGSGVLSCTQWRRSEDSSEGLYVPSIGQLVSVFGRVEEYRAEKQLRVSAIGSTALLVEQCNVILVQTVFCHCVLCRSSRGGPQC